jgi:hypothetical protein
MTAGAPIKYTPERLRSILNDIEGYVPYEIAAEANGIRERTLYAWIEQGKMEQDKNLETPLAKFSQDLKAIEANKIKRHFRKIDENVERWQGDAWILERRFHKHFGANALLREQEERLKAVEDKVNGDKGHGREETKD